MRTSEREAFGLGERPVLFDHPGRGLTTRRVLELAHEIRCGIERDPDVELGADLTRRHDAVVAMVAETLGLAPGLTALTASAAVGAAAVQAALPLRRAEAVVALDCERPEVLAAWQRRCRQVGARLVVVPLPLPVGDPDCVLAALDAADVDRVAVLQISAISPLTALSLPVARLVAWGHARGARVVLDAAHVPGHVDPAGWWGADLVFTDLHSWYPVPRGAGLLWAAADIIDRVRPLGPTPAWDAPRLAHRFAPGGSVDPTAHLCVPAALRLQAGWARSGSLERAGRLADHADELLVAAGAVATGALALRPPRLRGYLMPGVDPQVLQAQLSRAGLRARTGVAPSGAALLRIATHVFTESADLDLLAAVVARVVAGSRATTAGVGVGSVPRGT